MAELGPVLSNQVPKDLDIKYEYLVKALHHVQIKVWPPEAFEDGAEFMESLSKIFENAHGLRLKTTFAETLLQILHPIGKVKSLSDDENHANIFSSRQRKQKLITLCGQRQSKSSIQEPGI